MHPTQKPAVGSPQELTGTPGDTLRVAADYLLQHGWIQGLYFARVASDGDPCPAACAVGAIRYAVYGYANTAAVPAAPLVGHVEAAMQVLAEAIGAQPIPYGDREWVEVLQDCVAEWNDAPGFTAEDVADALLEAAEAHDRAVYNDNELDHDRIPTDEGFTAWQRARLAHTGLGVIATGGAR
jgi:hypothetical protein